MKEITFLILLICNFIFSNAQTNYTVNETHNTKSYGLKGYPKQIIEKRYLCKKDNTKVLDYIQTQQFDINGNATFVKYFSKNNSYTQYTYYKYNKTNNPIEEIIIGPNGKMFYKELNIYNELGKIIEKIRYNNAEGYGYDGRGEYGESYLTSYADLTLFCFRITIHVFPS